MPLTSHTNGRDLLKRLAAERILVLDGAMGTEIQGDGARRAGLSRCAFRCLEP